MDGATLASRHPDTPFVLMTGSPPAAEAALPAAVRARLVKPLDVPQLLTVLREAAGVALPEGRDGGARAGMMP
jgi:AmiR/NasT family two-component response regulator